MGSVREIRMVPSTVQDKVIAITGASSGIAYATAHYLAERGAHLSIADINDEPLERIAQDIKTQHNVEVIYFKVDVRNVDEVDTWITGTIEKLGRLDGAANLAGVIGKTIGLNGVDNCDEEDWDLNISVNLTGMMHCMRAQMKVIADGGSIVNASSIAGRIGRPLAAAYAASKHGVVGLTRSAAKEIGKRGVRVNNVAPGPISTPMNQAAKGISDKMLGEESEASCSIVLGRQGEPREVAALVTFLLGDESKFITGATYSIDGGWFC
jgi:NAD(P)-dependent dehydrogenase (short-subunit alcohol dehydrogenase family)